MRSHNRTGRSLARLAILAVLTAVSAGALLASREPVQGARTAVSRLVVAPSPSRAATASTAALVKPQKPRPTATPAPTARPAPKPVQTATRAALEPLVREVWPFNDEEAVAVVTCETGGTWNPRALGSSDDRGLFQIVPRYHGDDLAALGYTAADLFEPVPNIKVAARIFKRSGWGPWTCRRVLS